MGSGLPFDIERKLTDCPLLFIGKGRKIYLAKVLRAEITNEIMGLELLQDISSFPGEIYCLQISQDPDFVVFGGSDQKLRLLEFIFNPANKTLARLKVIPDTKIIIDGHFRSRN